MTLAGVALVILSSQFAVTLTSNGSQKVYASEVKRESGHYPPDFCTFTNVIFSHEKKKFFYESAADKHNKIQCRSVAGIWSIDNDEKLHKNYECDETFDIGYAFTLYYWNKVSNYYHLHKDMMMPLYGHAYYKKDVNEKGIKIAFMPTVESTRLKPLYWETDAFEDKEAYWYQSVEAIVGEQTLLPLDQNFLDRNKTICFDTIHFGTPKVDFFDRDFLSEFIKYMKGVYDIKDMKEDFQYKVGLISRSNRRLILNEDKLIEFMDGKVDLLKFDKMSIKDQIQLMQEYEVLLGMNGAGLMNGVYLPSHGVAVQLVPYNASVNFGFYGDLLHHRGPYLEWHNRNENNTRDHEGDKYKNNPDTIIDPEEFNRTVHVAMKHALEAKGNHAKDEL